MTVEMSNFYHFQTRNVVSDEISAYYISYSRNFWSLQYRIENDQVSKITYLLVMVNYHPLTISQVTTTTIIPLEHCTIAASNMHDDKFIKSSPHRILASCKWHTDAIFAMEYG